MTFTFQTDNALIHSQRRDMWAGRHAEQVSRGRWALFDAGRSTQAATALSERDAVLWVKQGHVNGRVNGIISKRSSAARTNKIAALTTERDRLRTALEFYAAEGSYDEETGAVGTWSTAHDPASVGSGPETEQRLDWGEVANIALGRWDAHGPLDRFKPNFNDLTRVQEPKIGEWIPKTGGGRLFRLPEDTGMLAAPTVDPSRPHIFIPNVAGDSDWCAVCGMCEDDTLNSHGDKHIKP